MCDLLYTIISSTLPEYSLSNIWHLPGYCPLGHYYRILGEHLEKNHI